MVVQFDAYKIDVIILLFIMSVLMILVMATNKIDRIKNTQNKPTQFRNILLYPNWFYINEGIRIIAGKSPGCCPEFVTQDLRISLLIRIAGEKILRIVWNDFSPWSVFPAQVCALAGDRPNNENYET